MSDTGDHAQDAQREEEREREFHGMSDNEYTQEFIAEVRGWLGLDSTAKVLAAVAAHDTQVREEGAKTNANLLRRRSLNEAPNARAALEFMAGVIESGETPPEHMLGALPIPSTGAEKEGQK